MTFVVVTRGGDAEERPPTRKEIRQLLGLASSVVDSLAPGFSPQSLTVWEEFPGKSLGGEEVHGSTPVVDACKDLGALLPASDLKLGGDSAMGTEPQFVLQPHHALEVSGRFRFGSSAAVPAWLHLNLYRPWARRAGDIVFDTSKTADMPYDGFYGLLSSDIASARPILRRVMESVSAASKELGGAARVRWAAVKETEGAEEPGFRAFLAQYRGYLTGRHSILSQAMRDTAVAEVGRDPSSAKPGLPPAYVSAVVKDIVDEISEAPAFDTAASSLEDGEGIEFVASGSGFYILPDPDAIANVASRILSNLRKDLDSAVHERLGTASRWDRELSRLAKTKPKRG